MKKFSFMWLILVFVVLVGGCTLDKPGDKPIENTNTVIVIMPNATNLISTSSNWSESLANSVATMAVKGWTTISNYVLGMWPRYVTDVYDIHDVIDTTNYVGIVTNIFGVYDIFTNQTDEFTNVEIGTTNIDYAYQTTNWLFQLVSDYTNSFLHTNSFSIDSTVKSSNQIFGSYLGQEITVDGRDYEWKIKSVYPYVVAWKRGTSYYKIWVITTTTYLSAGVFETNDVYAPNDTIIQSYIGPQVDTLFDTNNTFTTNANKI